MPFDPNTGQPIAPVSEGPKFDIHTGQPIVQQPIVPQPTAPMTYANNGNIADAMRSAGGASYMKTPPDKEYPVHDECCFEFCTGGGYQKIRLYKDDIGFETKIGPCPIFPIFFCCADLCCVFCIVKDSSTVTRVSYREIKGVELDETNAFGCCPNNKFYIHGLFGKFGRTPMLQLEMKNRARVEEMCSEIIKRSNEAKHYPPETMQRM